MNNSALAKVLLYPFSVLYGFVVALRNFLYDTEILRSSKFSIPVVSIGNLSIGGAGKTPHIEYLIDLFHPYIDVATLSRGYNRSTKGFKFVHPNHTAIEVGDEPLMYARKHRGIVVSVGESRALAIPQIIGNYPNTQVILLDDAYQHRSVQPFINILLTQHELPFTQDHLLPSGRLREWASSYNRADIIIVTKCPDDMSEPDRQKMIDDIKPKPHQHIFFTKYTYEDPYNFYFPQQRLRLNENLDALMISAIANTSYLNYYIENKVGSYHPMEYEDHHNFDSRDIDYIMQVYKKREKNQKFILSTEKDAMRLDPHRRRLYEAQIPVYILPIKVEFLFGQKEEFDQLMKDKMMDFEV